MPRFRLFCIWLSFYILHLKWLAYFFCEMHDIAHKGNILRTMLHSPHINFSACRACISQSKTPVPTDTRLFPKDLMQWKLLSAPAGEYMTNYLTVALVDVMDHSRCLCLELWYNYIRPRGPFHQQFPLKCKSIEITFCFHPNSNRVVATKFCTAQLWYVQELVTI